MHFFVYGKESIFPVNLEINALAMACQVEWEDQSTPLQSKLLHLMQLEE